MILTPTTFTCNTDRRRTVPETSLKEARSRLRYLFVPQSLSCILACQIVNPLHSPITDIKHPMDLSTVLKNVKSRVYKSKKSFARDLNLIWANCLQYNSLEVSNHDSLDLPRQYTDHTDEPVSDPSYTGASNVDETKSGSSS